MKKHQAWIFIVVGLAALAGLFVWLKPPTAPPAAAPRAETTATPSSDRQPPAAPVPKPKVVELVIAEGKLQSGPHLIELRQGDKLTLEITSDRNDELHLHGYDLHAQLLAGVPTTLSFEADRSGRFGYELHHAHLELGVLEVQPR